MLLGLAGYELIITNEAVGLVGYYQLISGATSKRITVKYSIVVVVLTFFSMSRKIWKH